eukprot:s139_g5.t1
MNVTTLKAVASGTLGCHLWGCRCQAERDSYPYQSAEDFQQSHSSVSLLSRWRRREGAEPVDVYAASSPLGYRTRAKLAVGPSREGGAVIGLFARGTFEVARCRGCAVFHPAIDRALGVLEAALAALPGVLPFDHAKPESWRITAPALRYVELTAERQTGLVQLVLLWNGERGSPAPALEELIEQLWPLKAAESEVWHSILVHWRAPDPSLQREMRSKRPDAWQQRRPRTRRGMLVATVREVLDGLPFVFGAQSFQQANMGVYEQILRDMKAALQRGISAFLGSEGRGTLRLLELCGGVGAIGLSLAHAAAISKAFASVALLSTDINPEGGTLFKANASQIFSDIKEHSAVRTEFAPLSLHTALRNVEALDGPAEVLIVNPPRSGLSARSWRSGRPAGEEEAQQIRESAVRVIIYMSCGPRSFMQDARRLTSPGGGTPPFRLASVRCYDLFPFTDHIETLGVFVREEAALAPLQSQVESRESLNWLPWDETSFARDGTPARRERGRWQCQFLVGIEASHNFGVVGRVIGHRGSNMKRIAGASGAKMRLRGRGSGFVEAELGAESEDPLMLCVSAPDVQSYRAAGSMIHDLFTEVYTQFVDFVEFSGEAVTAPKVLVHEGARD